ncbi:hypothetical protein BpHYR1_002841 [Brachionus plicatilis]|uniref:Uncharacterized protein n=1 Tax=Brachionus plicatilis TaxID=10195 RepID=A0A3M7SQS5_BRAPC|nr:hypothetical protein BpHYR1_002841 [Brachionus plicatilis]
MNLSKEKNSLKLIQLKIYINFLVLNIDYLRIEIFNFDIKINKKNCIKIVLYNSHISLGHKRTNKRPQQPLSQQDDDQADKPNHSTSFPSNQNNKYIQFQKPAQNPLRQHKTLLIS